MATVQPRVTTSAAPSALPTAHLDVAVRFAPALVIVRASGDLVAANAHRLEDALDATCGYVEPDQLLLLDLSRITHYDCDALASLGRVLTRVLDRGVELRIKEGPVVPPVDVPRRSR